MPPFQVGVPTPEDQAAIRRGRAKEVPPVSLVTLLPFIVLIAVWIFLSYRIRTTGQLFGFGGRVLREKVLADPKYWRARADEARTIAGQLGDHDSKRRMAEIAQGYEYLAQRTEERARGFEKST